MMNRPLSLFIFFICAFCATGVRASQGAVVPAQAPVKDAVLAEKCKILYDYQLKLIERNFDLAKKFITIDQTADGIKMPCHDIHKFLTNNGSYKPAVKTQKNIFKYTRYIATFCAATSAFLLAYCKPKQSHSFLCCGGLLTSLVLFFAGTCKLNHCRNIKRQTACQNTVGVLMGCIPCDGRTQWVTCDPTVYHILSADNKKDLATLPDKEQLLKDTQTLPNNVPKYISQHPNYPFDPEDEIAEINEKIRAKELKSFNRISIFKLARIHNENTSEEEKLEPEKNSLIIEAQKYNNNITQYGWCDETYEHKKLFPNKKPFILSDN